MFMSVRNNMRRSTSLRAKFAALYGTALLCALSACAVGPDFVPPDAPSVTHYTHGTDPTKTVEAEGTTQRFTPGAEVDPAWWHLFKSPKLDAILDEARTNNPGLEAAEANLRQSQDNLRSGYGIFFPEINGDAGASRQRSSPAALGQKSSGSIFNLFTLSATVSYAIDIWGSERRMVENLGAEVDMASATEQATYLTLSANIANTVIAKAAYHDEIEATQQLIVMQKEQVKLAELQEKAGTVPYSNVLSLRSLLASYEATLPPLEQKLAQTDDLLATLAGHTPAEGTPPEVSLTDFTLPNDLPISVPSDLVRQRPDILVAEATAHAASANVGVATAAMLPSITLNGGYGTNSNATNNLFAAAGNFWSFGAGLTTPIFDGGTLWFKREAATETFQQAMALYRQTVLGAFAQVADTLHALDHDAATLQAEDEALSTAEQTLHLVQANYKAGLNTYLDVLNADVQAHQAKIAKLQTIAARYQDTVALFAALGGGWWNAKNEHFEADKK
jgi:NodT family efflux transporter outer membrane factor (OMF) lipoprotein